MKLPRAQVQKIEAMLSEAGFDPKTGSRKKADPIPTPPRPRPDYSPWPGRFELAIPGWRPTTSNELRVDFWMQCELKKHDTEVVYRARLALGIPAAISRRRLTLTVRDKFQRFPDLDAFLKSGWDSLVNNDLLIDDRPEWLEFNWPPIYERGERLTTFLLEDIEPRWTP